MKTFHINATHMITGGSESKNEWSKGMSITNPGLKTNAGGDPDHTHSCGHHKNNGNKSPSHCSPGSHKLDCHEVYVHPSNPNPTNHENGGPVNDLATINLD